MVHILAASSTQHALNSLPPILMQKTVFRKSDIGSRNLLQQKFQKLVRERRTSTSK